MAEERKYFRYEVDTGLFQFEQLDLRGLEKPDPPQAPVVKITEVGARTATELRGGGAPMECALYDLEQLEKVATNWESDSASAGMADQLLHAAAMMRREMAEVEAGTGSWKRAMELAFYAGKAYLAFEQITKGMEHRAELGLKRILKNQDNAKAQAEAAAKRHQEWRDMVAEEIAEQKRTGQKVVYDTACKAVAKAAKVSLKAITDNVPNIWTQRQKRTLQ